MIDPLATNLVFQPLQFSRNRLEVLIDPADTTLTDRSSLRYALTLLVPAFPQSNEFEELTTLIGRERPPQTVGGLMRYDGAPFRIDEVLDGFLETQKPNFGQTTMSIVPTLTMPYCIRETITGGTPAVNTAVVRPKDWVFKGGVSNDDFAGWGSGFFDRYLRDTRQFLTWQPRSKTISVAQPEYLYFLLNTSPVPATINRRVELTYADGRVETRTTGTLAGAALFGVVCVPAGLTANAIPAGVSSYQVWLSDGDNRRISEVRSYVIDAGERPQERFLLLENSLGGFDTLRLLGQGDWSTSVRRTTVATDAFGASAIDYATLRVVETEGDQTLTVSTGYFAKDAAEWMRYLNELLLSKAIYVVTAKGHVPLLLTTTELVTDEDDTDLIARTLTFQRAKVEQNYSRLPATPPQPTRPIAWRGVGFRHLLTGNGFRTGLGAPIRLRQYYTDDNSDVKPITEKPNVPGDADYLPPTPIPSVVVGSTPFPNAALSRLGTSKRQTCGNGMEGGPATITVAAGTYGGESAGDADALAEAEYRATDTQEWADANGSCAYSEHYTWNVPAGQWHLRFSHATLMAVYHNDGIGGPADMGNTQSLQGQSGPFVYPAQANDLNFPLGDLNWLLYGFGAAYAPKRVRLYKNGTLLWTRDITINNNGFELMSLLSNDGQSYPPASGDRFYVNFEDR